MLVTLKEVLDHARKNKYCVAAFDCIEDVMPRAIMEAAEAERAPVILMVLNWDLETGNGSGWHYQIPHIKAAAEFYNIPIVLHLDHATKLEPVKKAVQWGLTGVMIDGSSLSFDENVALTKAAVEIARPKGVSVEAELGHVGGLDLAETKCAENVLTEPDEVQRFCELTGVDALAVSIGTSHGVYKAEPTLNIERLKELDAISPVPLVLHGGSGTPNDQIQESVRNGICKLNIYSDEREAMTRGLEISSKSQTRPDAIPQDIFGPIKNELMAVVTEKIRLLFSDGKAG